MDRAPRQIAVTHLPWRQSLLEGTAYSCIISIMQCVQKRLVLSSCEDVLNTEEHENSIHEDTPENPVKRIRRESWLIAQQIEVGPTRIIPSSSELESSIVPSKFDPSVPSQSLQNEPPSASSIDYLTPFSCDVENSGATPIVRNGPEGLMSSETISETLNEYDDGMPYVNEDSVFSETESESGSPFGECFSHIFYGVDQDKEIESRRLSQILNLMERGNLSRNVTRAILHTTIVASKLMYLYGMY